ncbi:MAG: tetratricopeptide repeat-containing sensor histidine kinase [Verrucomicrobia bacterium]|nr:tetratricopeptide repeat-containing sensor histidine kinase [Cytophagales bacterium]
MKKALLIIFLGSLSYGSFGQPKSNRSIDSLKYLLAKHPHPDSVQATYQIELAYQVFYLKPDTALILAQSALSTSQKLKLVKHIGRSYHALGKAYSRQGNDVKSLDTYLKAIPYFEKAKDARGLAITHTSIGQVHEKQRNNEKALDHYQKAFSIAKDKAFEDQLINLLVHIGTIYNRISKPDTALTLLKLALVKNKKYPDRDMTSRILENIGYVYFRRHENEKALDYFFQVLKNRQEGKNLFGEASAYKAIATVYKNTGEYQKSIEYATKSFEVADSANENDLKRGSAFILSEDYEKLGDYKNALKFQRIGEIVKDSLFTTEKNLMMSNLQTEFEIGRQQKEIDLLNKEKEINQKTLRNQEIQRNISIFGILLLGLIAGLFYRNFFRQQLSNRMLTYKNAEIEAQREQLSQLNTTKDKLFSVISHDLRGPLNSLEGTLLLLQEGYLTQEEVTYICRELFRKVQDTSALLNNMLHWAKSQMEGITAKPETFDLSEMSKNVCNFFDPVAEKKKIILENHISQVAYAFADKNITALILRNLLSNALKFTPENGKISLEIGQENTMWWVAVRDNGKGMNPRQMQDLFNLKTHFSTRGTANEAGTGLGLLLCKEFTEKNGGQIWVESTENQGSCFFFSLPVANLTPSKTELKGS